MRQARRLAALNRLLLVAYSRRTAQAVLQRLPMPAVLPWLDRLLANNVTKEVRKDREVIFSASRAAFEQRRLEDAELRRLLTVFRTIDREFLATMCSPLEIPVPYEQIEPLRAERIQRLFEATRRVCQAGAGQPSLRAALVTAFPGEALERLLSDLMISYAQETRAIGAAVRMPTLLQPLRRRVLASLYETMARIASELAREAASRLRAGRVASQNLPASSCSGNSFVT